jgi:hypothetical protein
MTSLMRIDYRRRQIGISMIYPDRKINNFEILIPKRRRSNKIKKMKSSSRTGICPRTRAPARRVARRPRRRSGTQGRPTASRPSVAPSPAPLPLAPGTSSWQLPSSFSPLVRDICSLPFSLSGSRGIHTGRKFGLVEKTKHRCVGLNM